MATSSLVLVVNCGSSSLKYRVYRMPERLCLCSGLVDRIGSEGGSISQGSARGEYRRELPIEGHAHGLRLLADAVTDGEHGVLRDMAEIRGVGHRVVHGGERYAASIVVDEAVERAIEENGELAPLHNPANLLGIREARALLPGVPQVAVFDTAFHQTIPPRAHLYALPRELYEKHRIRRYGFHGTSHRYVASRALAIMKRAPENTNVITCHLGNGASVTAIENGRSIDTSMGFTPLAGLVMGTRSGDIDPSIVFYLLERGYTASELNRLLNSSSGLLGLSGVSHDLRDVEAAADQGNPRAREALEVYAYRIRQYVGAYAANLSRVDMLVFTGGVGQNGVRMRERICHRLEGIGIVMDYAANARNGSSEGIISQDYSPVSILVIPTNEELQIAIDTYELTSRS
jgi:acetate kinase